MGAQASKASATSGGDTRSKKVGWLVIGIIVASLVPRYKRNQYDKHLNLL